MEMFDLRADYKTLPDETLRRHFRRLIKRQRRFSAFTFALLIPAVIIYGMIGWANYFAAESAMFAFFDASSNAFFNYAAFAACGAFSGMRHMRRRKAVRPYIMRSGCWRKSEF